MSHRRIEKPSRTLSRQSWSDVAEDDDGFLVWYFGKPEPGETEVDNNEEQECHQSTQQ